MRSRTAKATQRRKEKAANELAEMRMLLHEAEERAGAFLRILVRVEAMIGLAPDDTTLHDLPENVGRAIGLDEAAIDERLIVAWRWQEARDPNGPELHVDCPPTPTQSTLFEAQ